MNFNDVPDADDLNVKRQLAVPLYTGGRLTAGRKAARANTESEADQRIAIAALRQARGLSQLDLATPDR